MNRIKRKICHIALVLPAASIFCSSYGRNGIFCVNAVTCAVFCIKKDFETQVQINKK